MRIELEQGYFIDEKNMQFTLKKAYVGMRQGKETQCEKTISYHQTLNDALERFQRLFQSETGKSTTIPIKEYINTLRAATSRASEICNAATFFINIPSGTGERIHHDIADLIPVGRENAISRKMLVAMCVSNGLIDGKISDKDRVMRSLIEQARRDYTILNLSNGKGYYRPSLEDLQDLQRYIRQEERRAKSTFRNLTRAKELYEDYKAGRIVE